MPARIVLVHDNLEFLAAVESKLRDANHDVAVFTDSIAAFDALSSPQRIEALVTKVVFGPNQPHGIALAHAGRARRPMLKVIFAAGREEAAHIESEGTVFLMPVHPDRIVQAVLASLAA